MKTFFALSLLAIGHLAVVLAQDEPDMEKRRVYQQFPICSNSNSHCVYMTNAYTHGPESPNVRCRRADFPNNRGYDVCQMPDATTARISCIGDESSYLDVVWGQASTGLSSSFMKYGAITAEWVEQNEKLWDGAPGSFDGENRSGVPGVDLRVTCPSEGIAK